MGGSRVTIGRVVLYRSRTGDYDVPAIVTATEATLNPKGVAAGYIAPLTAGGDHVHLTVLSPGFPREGARAEAPDFIVRSVYPVSENQGGTYQEWDIPWFDGTIHDGPEPGSWRWPERD